MQKFFEVINAIEYGLRLIIAVTLTIPSVPLLMLSHIICPEFWKDDDDTKEADHD